MAVTLVFYFLCAASVSGKEGKYNTFRLLTLFPYPSQDPATDPSWKGGNDVRPAVDLAVDQINARTDILGNYSLQLIHREDGCDEHLAQITFTGFVEGLYSRGVTNLVGIIGPGCSSSTSNLAPLVGRPDIEMVTVHDAGSPSLTNRSMNPHLVGILGSSKSFIKSFLYLIRMGNWSRIAILYEDSRLYFVNTKRIFLELLSSSQLNVSVGYLSPVTNNHIPLMDIQQERLRVIFILAPISLAQNIMCLALKRGMVFSRYQFVLMSARLDDFVEPVSFYLNSSVTFNCSVSQLRDSLNNSFLVYYNLLPKVNETLLANISYSEYLLSYKAYRENYSFLTGKKSVETYWANNLYDAVWAWAVVLDRLTKENETFEFQYGDTDSADKIVQEFYRLKFEGMSGTVEFDESDGFITRDVIISQVQNNVSYLLTFISSEGEKRCYGTGGNETNEFCGRSAVFIEDTFQDRESRESKGLAIFFLFITVIQFIIVVGLHTLTFVHRDLPSVKASSLKLINISFIGTYILLLGTFLWTLYSAAAINSQLRHHFCQVLWSWTLPLGFSLAFSPIVMKTWRLYRIFEHYLDPGPFISTPYLMLGTAMITLLFVIVSIVWTTWDYFTVKSREYLDDKEGTVVERVLVWYCTCDYRQYWLLANGLLFLFLLSAGTVLGLITRKIQNASFATSSLRVLVYLMAIVIGLGSSLYAVSELVAESDRMSYFSFVTLSTVLNAVIFLFIACVFAPPLLPVSNKAKIKFKKISVSSFNSSFFI